MAASLGDTSIETRFAILVAALADEPSVELAAARRGFGRGTIQVGGRIFAMISNGRLVLKLPKGRVAELIATGVGAPFDAGKARPLAEWMAVVDADDVTWRDLAREAAAFVGGA